MYAEVIPLVRLPNNLHSFDYVIPDDAGSVKPGVLVAIPWRSKELFGIVVRVKQEAGVKKSKPISAIVHKHPLIPAWQLSLWQHISLFYHFSEASLAQRCVLPLQKRKIKNLTLSPLKQHRTLVIPAAPSYFNYARASEQRDYMVKHLKKPGTHLYLTAERFEAEQAAGWLRDAGVDHIVYHSELSQKEQFDAWCAVRNGEIHVVVGTKSALFLPFPQLSSILFDNETNDHHKNWDAQPLYHAREVAHTVSQLTGARLHLMSHIPSLETYAALQDGLYTKEKNATVCSTKQIRIVNMSNERKKGNYSAFSDSALVLIEQSRDQSILFFVNRRGYARALVCADCSLPVQCPSCALPLVFYQAVKELRCHHCSIKQPLTLTCTRCRGSSFKQYGRGTQQIAQDVATLRDTFKSTLPVVCLDSDNPNVSIPPAGWFVGTDFALSRIPWHAVSAIIVVDTDSMLTRPEYTALEQTYSRIMYFAYRMQTTKGAVLLQTYTQDHPLFAALKSDNYKLFMEYEYEARKKLNYPPAAYLVRLEATTAALIKKIHENIAAAYPTLAITGPYGKHEPYSLLLRFQKNMVQSALLEINAMLPADVRFDPNPMTL